MQIRVAGRQRFQVRLHHQFGRLANVIKQPKLTPRLLLHHPVDHAQHGRDADAAGDQHHRLLAAVQVEMTTRRARLQQATDLDVIVKIVGGMLVDPGHTGTVQCPLDRDPIGFRLWRIRQGVATHHPACTALRRRQVQPKGQELAWQRRRQRLAVLGHQLKRADLSVGIFQGLGPYPKRAVAGPGRRLPQGCMGLTGPPKGQTHESRQLQQQGSQNPLQ